MDRVSGFEPEGRRFDSCRGHQECIHMSAESLNEPSVQPVHAYTPPVIERVQHGPYLGLDPEDIAHRIVERNFFRYDSTLSDEELVEKLQSGEQYSRHAEAAFAARASGAITKSEYNQYYCDDLEAIFKVQRGVIKSSNKHNILISWYPWLSNPGDMSDKRFNIAGDLLD